MAPEGDPELPDDGLPDEQPDDDDDCSRPADVFRSKQEDLGDTHER